jgi:surface polysaccharide O-acyltransferase-like enzyme
MGDRKYFLDWLRVLAFGFLILFHIGCLYATWTYNLKSPRIVPEVEWFLLALHPWRMALLFIISGVASTYLVAKLGAGGYALDRLRRLVPVILFGCLVVVPPQVYVEALSKHLIAKSYPDFWLHDYLGLNVGLMRALHKYMPTYDHLWFIVYLLVYALVFALIAAVVRAGKRPPRPLPLWLLVSVPALWLVATTYVMERIWPATFWITNDWGSHLRWAGLFLIGSVLAGQDRFWGWTQRWRLSLLALALVCLALQSLNRLYYLTGRDDPLWSALRWSLASGLFSWFTICALFGYAGRYLNRSSAVLSHLNQAILPVYVLHQPVMLVTAFYLFPLGLPLAQEVAILLAVTALGSFAIYEVLVRPFGVMRFLFGLRNKGAV